MTLAELRGGVTIELERQCQRRLGVGQHRTLSRGSRGDLGDTAHADRMMIAAGQQCLTRRRAQRGGVEARELQPALRQLREVRRLARTTERTGGAVAHVVNKDHKHIGRALRRAQVVNRREPGVRIFRVVCDQARVLYVGYWKTRPLDIVPRTHPASPLESTGKTDDVATADSQDGGHPEVPDGRAGSTAAHEMLSSAPCLL